jgi:uncharacterized cupredoxin-like copper-binding protein
MNRILAIVLCAAALAAGYARADTGHGGHEGHKTAAATKEQKPWGIAGDAKAANRTVVLTMTDNMRFTPDYIEVKQGDVVKFLVKNSGKLLHEIVLGTRKELDEHAALMRKFPNMEHDESGMLHVKPGTTGHLVWNFNRAGEFDFACLIPGHYEAGMAGKIKVIGSRNAATGSKS